jgi:NADP-dependent 3-hydroxy acid dehydrogenase YdfG
LSGLAVVTGAGSGIGRAVALRLASAGYACLLVGRREARLQGTQEAIEAAGSRALTVPSDVRDPAGRDAILEAVDAAGARITALVNNAGRSSPAPLFGADLEAWRADFALNVEARRFCRSL